MKTKANVCWAIFFLVLSHGWAQLNGTYTPDASSLQIPVFDGVELAETISSTDFSITMEQLINSKAVTGSGNISATEFFVAEDLTVDNFDGELIFTAAVAMRGSIVSLSGAKATLRNVTGGATYTAWNGTNYDVTVTAVTGAFSFSSLQVDLAADQISGTIKAGSLKVSGYLTDDPSSRGSATGRFLAESFGPFDFSGDIISPNLSLTLATNEKGAITGTGVGTFGGYDDVEFSIKGKRNTKKGLSTVTLTSTNLKGVSAVLNLDDSGDLSGTANSLKVLGYSQKF